MHKGMIQTIIKQQMVKIVIICVLDINGPLGASQSWFQKFVTKSKLIQSIIYKRHQVGWHLKYSQKLISKKNSPKIDFFCVLDKKNLSCDIPENFPLCIHFSHQDTFFVNLIRVLNFTWLG
jgi:hypothetical protein